MLDASYYEKTDEIIACHTREERSLIPIIQDIQEEYRYLPPELLSYDFYCGGNFHREYAPDQIL